MGGAGAEAPPAAVIFDIGGVLASSPVERLRALSRGAGLPAEALGVAVGSSAAFRALETGAIGADEFAREAEAVAERLRPARRIGGREVLRAMLSAEAHDDVLAAVAHLRRAVPGLKTGVITNNFPSRGSAAFRERTEHLFDAFVESWVVRMRKPAREIFLHAAEALGVPPERCLFVDDLGQNLKGARAAGMQTYRVVGDDTPSLLMELERRFSLADGTLRALYPKGVALGGVPERHRFDEAAVLRLLAGAGVVEEGEGFARVEMFSGGKSNPTFYLKARRSGGEFVLRKQPNGHLLKGAHSMQREFALMKALATLTDVPVPKPVLLCTDRSAIGTEFYVMRYVKGEIFPSAQAMVKAHGPHHFRDAYCDMIRVLGRLHKLPHQRLQLPDSFTKGKEGCYFARTIRIWDAQYAGGLKQGTPDVPEFVALRGALEAALPRVSFDLSRRSLLHGDYKLDNVMFDARAPRVVALLDLELATVGHPYSDLGYLLMFHRLPASAKGMGAPRSLPEDEVLARYAQAAGVPPPPAADVEFLVAFSMFRLAAIVHGVWSRALRGTAANVDAGAGAAQMGAMCRSLAKMGVACLARAADMPGAKL